MIPYNRQNLFGTEYEYIRAVYAEGHISGDGSMTRACHRILKERTGCHTALLTTSCTHALEICALLLKLQPGDEIILPAFTFVSTANAFILHGATPVFVDVRRDTLNMDEHQVEAHLTERTRAIVPVHYAGVACDMDALYGLAERCGVPIIEDNAHGLGGAWHGRPLGGWGMLATQSFHESKNFSCGEGGALLINRPELVERAEILREKGTNRSRFFRGEIDKYGWVDIGSSYLPSELVAAALRTQLESFDLIQGRRRAIWQRYASELASWASMNGVQLPMIPDGADPAWHIFHLLMPDLESRTALIRHMKAQGVLCVFHYQALNTSEVARRWGYRGGECPVAEMVSERIVRLPLFYSLTEAEVELICGAVKEFKVGPTHK